MLYQRGSFVGHLSFDSFHEGNHFQDKVFKDKDRKYEKQQLKLAGAITKETEALLIFFSIHKGNTLEIGRRMLTIALEKAVLDLLTKGPLEEVCQDFKKMTGNPSKTDYKPHLGIKS